MDEGNEMASRTNPRLLIDQMITLCFHSRKFCTNIVHLKRQMMHTFSAFVDKFLHRRISRGRLRKFQRKIARLHKCQLYLLLIDLFGSLELRVQEGFEELSGRCKIFDSDANMRQLLNHDHQPQNRQEVLRLCAPVISLMICYSK